MTASNGVRCFRWAGFAGAGWALAGPAASGQTFQGLGTLGGLTPSSFADAISGDGSTIVGRSNFAFTDESTAVRWVNGVGPEPLMPQLSYSYAYGVNSDGSVIVGLADIEGGAFRWTGATGAQPLGSLPSNAVAVNSDGSVIAGSLYFFSPQEEHVLRWTFDDGYTDLGVLPGGLYARGNGVSGDGRVIAGASDSAEQSLAFRWTHETGLESLGTLPGGSSSSATAVSRDGAVIVGWADPVGPGTNMFRWTASKGMEDLGGLAGWQYALARAVNANGSVIVGQAYQPGGDQPRAILWRRGGGVVDLNTYLSDAGIDLSEWVLFEATGVSDDGRTITGTGVTDRHQEGWVVTLPGCPADFNEDLLVNSQDFFDFLTAYFGADMSADLNHDGEVTSADFFDFMTEFLGGCV